MRSQVTLCSLVVAALLLGFDLLLDLWGAKKLIANFSPILAALLPIVGGGIIAGALSFIALKTREWDAYRSGLSAIELEEYIASGEQFFAGIKANQLPIKEAGTFVVLSEKYKDWVVRTDENGSHSWNAASLNQAARIAATFRAYGYLRGRWRIWRGKLGA